jgi:hypothetical protein
MRLLDDEHLAPNAELANLRALRLQLCKLATSKKGKSQVCGGAGLPVLDATRAGF